MSGMSVADQQDRHDQLTSAEIDLSDLGTIPVAALESDRADPRRQAERRAALEALDALERDGRLLIS